MGLSCGPDRESYVGSMPLFNLPEILHVAHAKKSIAAFPPAWMPIVCTTIVLWVLFQYKVWGHYYVLLGSRYVKPSEFKCLQEGTESILTIPNGPNVETLTDAQSKALPGPSKYVCHTCLCDSFYRF